MNKQQENKLKKLKEKHLLAKKSFNELTQICNKKEKELDAYYKKLNAADIKWENSLCDVEDYEKSLAKL